MKIRIGGGVPHQDLDRSASVRDSEGVVPQVNGEAKIRQDQQEQPQKHQGFRSRGSRATHLHSILLP